MRRALLLWVNILAFAAPAAATDYYFSADGYDGAAGTSATQPWLTIGRLRTVRLAPGDRVLLRGGDVFWGSIALDPDEPGTPAAPIVITSYGSGRATIMSGDGSAIGAYNVAGYRIANLVLVGAGATNVGSGIDFYSDRTDGVLLPYIRVDNVDASGYGGYGVLVGAAGAATGYRDIRITGVAAHHNARGGIFTYAATPNTHRDVYVGYSAAHSNSGIAGATTPTGNGILLGGVNGGTIERSVAYGNGWLNNYSAGPVGIWTYDSRSIVIQHNESHHNRTGNTKDGGGFGLDQNTSYSVLQYNYSHDNDGAGYLLAMRYGTSAHTNNVIRYNISQNDSRKTGYGAIHLWGGIRKTEIYNNTVFLSPAAAGTPYGVFIKSSSYTSNDLYEVHFRNNIFQTTGSVRLLTVPASQLDGAVDFVMERNVYFTTGGAFTAVWAGVTYTSFDAWRSASGQESSGRVQDPQLTAPGAGSTYDDASLLGALDAYRLGPGSPLIDAGLEPVPAVNSASQDFYGTALPQGGGYDIGADEGGGICGGVTVAPSSQSYSAAAATGAFQVTAPGACNWTAASNASWVTTSPLTGRGDATVSYAVQENAGPTKRSARITVGGRTLTITQEPGAATAPATGIGVNFVGTHSVLMGSAESAGVVGKTNWNNATGSARSTPMALIYDNGADSGATMTWAAAGTWMTPITDGAGNRRMMKGYLDTTSTSTTTVTVSGLAARTYDVYVYADGANGSYSRTAAYTISGPGITTTRITLTDPPSTNFSGTFTQASDASGNYVKFTINATGFTLTAKPVSGGSTTLRAPINGIQIVP